MTDSPAAPPKVATVSGTFSQFHFVNTLPKLLADDGTLVLVGVPKGDLEDFARACWRNQVKVEISGPVRERDGHITAINVESMRVVVE